LTKLQSALHSRGVLCFTPPEELKMEEKKKIVVIVKKLNFLERLSLRNEDLESIIRIARQHNKDSRIDRSIIYSIANQPKLSAYLALDSKDKKVIGFAHLVEVLTFANRHGRIEDVVVDEEYRGCGVGRKLMEQIIHDAKEELELPFLELTSKPERQAANHLYEKLGFNIRETNVRRLVLNSK
jgi:ribosomal protein S18 acetylase RimI-like enzyme